ncbi:hypothetical protein, partial [Bifidobacterium longum]|uniref:hypothetical protein n=1 Tax=Bifidobacterium longum TaxID=216816 RepID=UPI0032C187B9
FVSVASGHLTLLAVGQVLQRSLEPAWPSAWFRCGTGAVAGALRCAFRCASDVLMVAGVLYGLLLFSVFCCFLLFFFYSGCSPWVDGGLMVWSGLSAGRFCKQGLQLNECIRHRA